MKRSDKLMTSSNELYKLFVENYIVYSREVFNFCRYSFKSKTKEVFLRIRRFISVLFLIRLGDSSISEV